MNKMVRNPQWPSQGLSQDPIRQVFDRLFEGSLFESGSTDESSVVTSQWVPLVDIKEEANRFVLYADLPGVDPQDIEVQMDKGILTIKGERRSERTLETESFSRIERRHGSFHRRFALPDSADLKVSPPRVITECCRSSSRSDRKPPRGAFKSVL